MRSSIFLMSACSCLALIFSPLRALTQLEESSFPASFIYNYGFSANARVAHDYHPYTVARCCEYFLAFERALQESALHIEGRILIMGYQEDAIPRYATRYDDQMIADEPMAHTESGWDFTKGNLFGFMTGYLLQDVPSTHRQQAVGEHVARDRVELFHDRMALLQRHAFGKSYDLLRAARQRMHICVRDNDRKGMIQLLHDTWQSLYVQAVCDGSGYVIATQNILFSLYYARHLLASSLPYLYLFTGPDITYPIEPGAHVRASEGAQRFVQRFVQELVPRNGHKTAYILCSFVDGVGKTTLMSNIRNWLAYGHHYSEYEHVDNSSSQEATLYSMNDQVVVVDLPALMSHVMMKPDGSVLVDCASMHEYTHERYAEIKDYALMHQEQYAQDFPALIDGLSKHDIRFSSADTLLQWYAKNSILFNRQMTWIPFMFDDQLFALHPTSHELRVAVPLSQVHSAGLKEKDPTLMLLHGGIRYAPPYEIFLDTLIKRLQDEQVTTIVLVDCMGMYPRTSRETVRLNCVMQQMRRIFAAHFNYQASFYRHATTAYDLYHTLLYSPAVVRTQLLVETIVRWGLHELMQVCQQAGCIHLAIEEVQRALDNVCHELLFTRRDSLERIINGKIDLERQELENTIAHDPHFQAVTCFSCSTLCALSDTLCKVWGSNEHDTYASLWRDMSAPLDEQSLTKHADPHYARLQSGQVVEILYAISSACKDSVQIHELVRILRAHWYAATVRLLCPTYAVFPPLVLKQSSAGMCYAVRPCLTPYAYEDKQQSPWIAGDQASQSYGSKHGVICCLDWSFTSTTTHAYAFGYDPYDQSNVITQIMNALLAQRRNQQSMRTNVTTAALLEALAQHSALFSAQQTGNASKQSHNSSYAPLVVRMLATLDMLLADSANTIMVRKDVDKDFTAALLLHEHITLPRYCHFYDQKPLFEDYTCIRPLVEYTD